MNTEQINFSIASLVVVLGFPPVVLYQINKRKFLKFINLFL